jgi:propanediol utilization protein
MNNKDLVYRKLDHNDRDLFIRLRLDFINEFHKDVDEMEKEKLKASLQNYFDRHIKNKG